MEALYQELLSAIKILLHFLSEILRKNIFEMAASLLACGLDPDKCLLFQQSRVFQHTELSWILGCNCSVPSLARLSQYREKSEKLKVRYRYDEQKAGFNFIFKFWHFKCHK